MGVRAVIAVRDDCGQERRFWAPWASKQYQIPYLAEFIHTADCDRTPLDVGGYLAYTAAHPDTLPAHDITDHDGDADPTRTGDLDHRYHLMLCDRDRTFRYVVYDRLPSRAPNRWRVSYDLATRRELYVAAARMCRELATNLARYMAANNGIGLPGQPGPDYFRGQEQQFTHWLEQGDPQLLHLAAGQPAPPRYTLDAARALARQVNTHLRPRYPDVTIRTRVAADGVLSMTVPARLATDTDAELIASLVGDLVGEPYTATVRPHRQYRRSRHDARTDDDGRHPGRYVTLILRPAGPAATGPTATHRDNANQK